MALVTTVFQMNDRAGGTGGWSSITPFRFARAGGAKREVIPGIGTEFATNETASLWYPGAPDVGVVSVESQLSPQVEIIRRFMIRFLLGTFGNVGQDRSHILSGPTPPLSWWPFVSGARLVWYNGDPGGVSGGVSPVLVDEVALNIYAGRGLYVPAVSTERPFGRLAPEPNNTYSAATTFGTLLDTLDWSEWAVPDRTAKMLTLTSGQIDALLKTINSDLTAYLDFAFVAASENTNGTQVSREIGAWDPFPPTLEVDFDLSQTVALDALSVAVEPGDIVLETPVSVSLDAVSAEVGAEDLSVVVPGITFLQTAVVQCGAQSLVVLAPPGHHDPHPLRTVRPARESRFIDVARRN